MDCIFNILLGSYQTITATVGSHKIFYLTFYKRKNQSNWYKNKYKMYGLLADTARLCPLKFKFNFITANFCTLYYTNND